MDFSLQTHNDGAAADPSEDLQSKYEMLKESLSQISAAFELSLQSVKQLMVQYSDQISPDFISAFQSQMGNLQQTITTVISANESSQEDASPLGARVKELEDERSQWETQKNQGMEMLKQLQERNSDLEGQISQFSGDQQRWREDQQKWQQEKATGYELMAKYQEEIAQLKGSSDGTNVNSNDQSVATQPLPPDMDPNQEIGRLNQIIEMGKGKVLQLQQEKSTLEGENHSLNERVKQMAALMKEKGITNLYRSNTFTDWDQSDLNALKEEMMQQMTDFNKQELAKKFEEYENVYWNEDQHTEPPPEQPIESKADEEDDGADETDDMPAVGAFPRDIATGTATDTAKPKSKAFRTGTKTDWDAEELNKLKDELASEMQEMQKEQMTQFFDRQDKLRFGGADEDTTQADTQPDTQPIPTKQEELPNLVGNMMNENNDVAPSEDQLQELRDQMRSEMQKLHQQSLQQMIERSERLRWETGDESESKTEKTTAVPPAAGLGLSPQKAETMRDEMMAQIEAMTKNQLAQMFDKQFNLRTAELDAQGQNKSENTHGFVSVKPLPRSSHLMRDNTKTDWDEGDLEKLKLEMMEQINAQQKEELSRMIEGQFDSRWQGYDEAETLARREQTMNANMNETDAQRQPQQQQSQPISQPSVAFEDMPQFAEYRDMTLANEEKMSGVINTLKNDKSQLSNEITTLNNSMATLNNQIDGLQHGNTQLCNQIDRLTENKMRLIQNTANEIQSLRSIIVQMNARQRKSVATEL